MVEERPWPDFHAKGLHLQVRVGRIQRAAEQPEARQRLGEFARVFNEPFAPFHRNAAEALLKLHDADKKDRRPIRHIAAGYRKMLTEYRKRPSIVGLKRFLEDMREELRNRGVKVKPLEKREAVNPLAAFRRERITARTAEPDLHPDVKRDIRKALSPKRFQSKTFSEMLESRGELAARVDVLMEAFLGPLTLPFTSGEEYTAPEPSLRANARSLRNTGIRITINKPSHPTIVDGAKIEINRIKIELSPALKKFLREYKHKP